MTTELNAERARKSIVEHTERLAYFAVAAGAAAEVPTCPDWTVDDLVAHVGQTQHWVSEWVERRITDPSQIPTEMAEPPTGPGEWQPWLSESASRAAAACSDSALDAPVFNPAGDERTGAQFWLSSLLNEAVVHGFDAAAAAGHMAADIAPDVAAALISNHLAMLTSPTWAIQRPESAQAIRGTGQTLQWRATDVASDAASAWFVERRPDGAVWQQAIAPADATIHGPAQSLLLTMTRRLPLHGPDGTDLSIDGDFDLVQHWVDNTAHVAD